MGTVIKSYLSVFLILVAVFTFGGIISVTIDVQNARDYHAAVINEIENSNHAQSVIDACIEEAESNGYELTVVSYPDDSVAAYNSAIVKVTLKYDYSINLLSIGAKKEIIGYAR